MGFVFSWEIGCTDLSLYGKAGLAQRLSLGTHPNLVPLKKEVVEVWGEKVEGEIRGTCGDKSDRHLDLLSEGWRLQAKERDRQRDSRTDGHRD